MLERALKRWGPWLLAGARAAHRNEDGGTMVFGAMTLFTLVIFTMLVYMVGMTSGDKIQLQTASDSEQGSRDREFEQQQRDDEKNQNPHGPKSLSGEVKLPAKIKEAAEQQGFQNNSSCRHGQRR